MHTPLMPAKAGIQLFHGLWVPAFAGTSGDSVRYRTFPRAPTGYTASTTPFRAA
jgi:hypothetical protein